ncbi:MAG: transposase [Desulfobacteraceae bacterium]|nr:transposase [Desulfobacteraceae bacterium]
MPESNDLPELCLECAGFHNARLHKDCDVCHEMGFRESILCDLNRSVQQIADFQCHAFRPALRHVGALEKKMPGQDVSGEGTAERDFLKELFHSDKVRYERALALQMLHRDPDTILVQLKYHLVWNVSHRTPVFVPVGDFIDVVHDAFLESSEVARGFVNLLYLAPDHVHVYVESDGERSLEGMANDIKRLSAQTILEKFPSLRDTLGASINIWDEAYFVETVG